MEWKNIRNKGHPIDLPHYSCFKIKLSTKPIYDSWDASPIRVTDCLLSNLPVGPRQLPEGTLQILTASHWAEPTDPNGRVGGVTEGAEGDYNPIGRKTKLTNQTSQSPQGLPPHMVLSFSSLRTCPVLCWPWTQRSAWHYLLWLKVCATMPESKFSLVGSCLKVPLP